MAEDTSLFSISCDTCAARLKVRNASAIGQVLACPRCGSMVMVEAPDGWVAPARPASEPLPRRPRDPNDSQATLSGEFGDLKHVATATAPASQRRVMSKSAATATGQSVEGQPVLPDGSWDPAAARGRSRVVAWVAAIGGVCLIALVAVIYMVTSMTGGTDPETTAQANPDSSAEVAAVGGKSNDSDDADADANPDVPEPVAGDGVDTPATDTPDAANGTGDSAADATKDNPNSTLDPDTGTDPPPVAADSDSAPEPAVTSDEPLIDVDDSLVKPDDPLALNQSGSTMMEDVGNLGDLLANPGPDNLQAIRDIGTDSGDKLIGIGKVYIPRPDVLEIDFDRQLAEVFPGISYQDLPLIEFLRNLNVLTGIPIQLDSHSVTSGAINPVVLVSYKGTSQSVIEIINAAVAELNLVAVPVAETGVIVVVDRTQNEFSEHQLELDPLLAGDAQQNEELIALIAQVTGPELWSTGGGQARIELNGNQATIEADGRLADEAKRLLKKLGAAAQMNAGADDPATRSAMATLWSASRETLDAADAFHAEQRSSIRRILNQVFQYNGLVVLVDWQSVMPHSWNPSVTMPWPSSGLTVGETLGDITSSMGLASRLIGPNIVEIVAQDKYWDAPRIEVYPCQKQLEKFTAEQIMSYLQANVAADIRDTGSLKRVEYLPRFQCVVARLPEPLQQRVEKTLLELGR